MGQVGQLEQLEQLEQLAKLGKLGQLAEFLVSTPFVRLFVVQPTPFCNIDCNYCYLPDRLNTGRLSATLFRESLFRIHESGLAPHELSIVWHAGEPLALPVSYYREIFEAIEDSPIRRDRIRHSMQTNGTLLSDEWCEFIISEDIHIGLSIDGPAFLHDAHRKDRQGRGTHARAMQGIAALRRHGIDFHVIAVVTSRSLAHADEIFQFFVDHGVRRVGFNIEELEGCHRTTSLNSRAAEESVRQFWTRLFELQKSLNGEIQIREFERGYSAVMGSSPESDPSNEQVIPLGILNMDWRGNLSSFSPELLGVKSVTYGDFNFGRIDAGPLSSISASEKFQRVAGDIALGVELCRSKCPYFCLCGGGAPANKYFENGSFESSETMYCRTTIQMPIDLVLADLERQLGIV